MINSDIRAFQQGIIDYINNNHLPIELKRLVLIDILHQTTEEANRVVLSEMEGQKNGVSENEVGE